MKYFFTPFIVLFFLVSISESFTLLFGDYSQYPFGSDFFSKWSLYRSYELYLFYNLIITSLSICYLFYFKKKIAYLFLILIFVLEGINIMVDYS